MPWACHASGIQFIFVERPSHILVQQSPDFRWRPLQILFKTQISRLPSPDSLDWGGGPGTYVLIRSQVIMIQMVLEFLFASTLGRLEPGTLLDLQLLCEN